MIVIMSIADEESTNGVIDWLDFYQKEFIRINPDDIINEIHIDERLDCNFKIDGRTLHLNTISAYWYRRGSLNLLTSQIKDETFPFTFEINKHLKAENLALGQFILRSLERRNVLGSYFNTDVNKFEVLQKAQSIGLKIPETIVTSSKKELLFFLEKHQLIITKCNSEVIFKTKENISLISYTKRIGLNEIDSLTETFSSSLFQREVKKRYELRIFFIDNIFYPMAIFSQLDGQTEVDFRVYNELRPNRNIPFNLPAEIEDKLYRLMIACGYNTGSIDMIVTDDNSYVFLEVNPVGQFDMVSFPCNYHLQKTIADKLCLQT